MGLTKVNPYTQTEAEIAQFAKALAHPARVAIIQLLLQKQTCICGDIVNEIELSQSTVSQHLKELKNAGIIKGEIDGPRTCYCINEEVWKTAQTYFGNLFNAYTCSDHCC